MNLDTGMGGEGSNWRGVPVTEIHGSQSPWGAPELPLVSPAFNHTVLYHISSNGIQIGERPPKPQIGHDKWDHDFVRMPCSSQSLYPVEEDGTTSLKKRWDIIEEALLKPIENSDQLADAILTYNTKFKTLWKFRAMHKLFNEYLEEEEAQYFFTVTLPEIAKLALALPKLIQSPIPLLKQHKNKAISLSQQQIASLLANAFFCTFPRRNATKKTSEYASYPHINFITLYESSGSDAVLEKLKCICHYFRRVCTKVPVGVMTFIRRSVPPKNCPNWAASEHLLAGTPLHVNASGTIEDDGVGLIQVDFANKYLGGGVLNRGCVQEEIRFVICTELLISMLFTEVLRPNEALLMIGCERFSKYTGYGNTFQWAGDYSDNTPYDSSGRRRCAVLAIDALPFGSKAQEYRKESIAREINKAWVGMSFCTVDQDATPMQYPGVATGNWGCGAFGGTASLKSLLQLMAATEAKRPMAYYTFGDVDLRNNIINIYNLLSKHNVTVGQLYKIITKFSQTDVRKSQLYPFIHQTLIDQQTASAVEAMDVSGASDHVEKEENSPDLFSQELDESFTSAVNTNASKDRKITSFFDFKSSTTLEKYTDKTELQNRTPKSVPTENPTKRQHTSKLFEEMEKFDEECGVSFKNTHRLPLNTSILETSLHIENESINTSPRFLKGIENMDEEYDNQYVSSQSESTSDKQENKSVNHTSRFFQEMEKLDDESGTLNLKETHQRYLSPSKNTSEKQPNCETKTVIVNTSKLLEDIKKNEENGKVHTSENESTSEFDDSQQDAIANDDLTLNISNDIKKKITKKITDYFRKTFPKDHYLRKEWVTFCHRNVNWVPTRTSVICSDHFDPLSFEPNTNYYRRRLTESAKPTIFHCDFKKSGLKRTCPRDKLRLISSKLQVQPADDQKATLINPVPSSQSIPLPDCVSSTSAAQSQLLEIPRKRKRQATLFEPVSSSKPIPSSDRVPSMLAAQSQLLETPTKKKCRATLIDPVSSSKSIPPPDRVPSTSAVQSELLETPRKRKLRGQLAFEKKKVKRLQAKNRYLKKKVRDLQELLDILSEKSLIDKEERSILEKIGVEEKELLQRQLKKTGNKLPRTKYSPELRCFALTLNYYSPKAYKYVRKTFGTCLPHPRTLSKWYSHIDGKPGFTQEALNALKTKAEEESDKIYCAHVIDEIKIKQHTEWDPKTQRYFGYVNHGFEYETDNNDLATDSLVFLVVGINKIFKIPIGYFLVKGTSGIQKAQLITDALALINEAGVEIKALTCDGTRANLAMAEELGCSLDPTKLQTTFLDPASGQKVHFFLDHCHMLKLIRNTFENYGCLITASEEKIKWNYLENLHKTQEKELFFMANKLRANHIYFKWKIMSVKLAAQLFSQSVADALLFCQNILKLPDFEEVTATADFIKLVNDVFDILDSRTKQWGFKRALSIDNYEKAFERLDEASALFMDLYADLSRRNGITRLNLLKSPRYTGFLGILVCIASTKSMFESLVINGSLSYLPMHKISQDHIEIFFSVVRSHGGYSDNPTARQFEAIYKKLLIHGELQAFSTGTNCMPLEKIIILNCSSGLDKINHTSRSIRSDDASATVSNPMVIDTDAVMNDIESQTYLSPFGEKVLEYIAGFVVFALSNKLKCNICVKGLLGPHNVQSLTNQKSRGRLVHASTAVIDLCRQCEILIRRNLDESKRVKPTVTTTYIVSKSLSNFQGKDIFPNISRHVFDNDFVNHNMELGRLVMQKYTDTRISFLMKKTNPQKCVRHIYNKLIHFKNQ